MRHVLSGKTYVSEKISAKILDHFSGRPAESSSPVERLTDREFEVFRLIGQGLTVAHKGGSYSGMLTSKLCVLPSSSATASFAFPPGMRPSVRLMSKLRLIDGRM